MTGFGQSADLEELVEALLRTAESAEAAARETFASWLLGAGILRRHICSRPAKPPLPSRFGPAVIAAGRLADLFVIPRPLPETAGASLLALDAALFESGRPVLLVSEPYRPVLFRQLVIGWNGSREAARAVMAALPFARACEGGQVGVFTRPERQQTSDALELVSTLAWHGIAAKVLRHERPPNAVADELLSPFDGNGGLVAMGAYSHSPLRERVLGGVTHHMIHEAALPILMAH